jgi:hypothetical protein
MIQITAVSNEFKQEFNQTLPNGEIYKIYLYFIPIDKSETQEQLWNGNWYINLEYKDIKIYGRRVCANIDLFDDYSNILPYGIFVECQNEIEPWFLDSFNLEFCNLYIISSEEKKSNKVIYT